MALPVQWTLPACRSCARHAMAMAVAPIVIMMPGIYAYEMIVLFNRGPMLDALQASAICGFVIGALAMGLATARFFVRS